jgi:hypothetical protein
MNESVAIRSSDFWVKVVEMLQQNWAVIEAARLSCLNPFALVVQ